MLQQRELEAALRVLEALRRPAPASVVLSWDNDMQDALGGLQRVGYVERIKAYGEHGPRKSSAPFRSDRLVTTDLGKEYLGSIRKSSHATKKETAARIERATYWSMRDNPDQYPPGALTGVSKKTRARLDREIEEILAKRRAATHATRKTIAYRIKLTPSELKAVEFARGRYAWPDMLSAHAAEDGSVTLTESEMWQWTDDVDSDDVPFPLASPGLAAKLQRFYDERV